MNEIINNIENILIKKIFTNDTIINFLNENEIKYNINYNKKKQIKMLKKKLINYNNKELKYILNELKNYELDLYILNNLLNC